MITLGKRKFDIKRDNGSLLDEIKKPKQEFQSPTISISSDNSFGKVIGMVADSSNKNGGNKVVCLKLVKRPISLPTSNSINNTCLSSKDISTNNVVHNSINNTRNTMEIKPSPLLKPLIVSQKSSPLTSFRISSQNSSPLNPITNIVIPIKQEKLSNSTLKFQAKKECIIKPLNIPKDFFQTSNNDNNTISYNNKSTTSYNSTTTYNNSTTTYNNSTTTYNNSTTTYNNSTTTYNSNVILSPVPKQKPVMRIISLQKHGFKQEKSVNVESPKKSTQKIRKLKTDDILQPVRLKAISPIKTKPTVVVSPLNYQACKLEEDSKASLELEDIMIKSSIKIKEEQPVYQDVPHASLWYDSEQTEFTASNFLTDSPLRLLKNMLVSGSYITEYDAVTYMYNEQEIPGDCTLKELGVPGEYMLVDIKFIHRINSTVFIDIYSVTPSAVTMVYNPTDTKTNNCDFQSTIDVKRRKCINKKRKDKSGVYTYDKGGRIQLWQFLLTTLLDGQHPDKIEWTSTDGEFKFNNPDLFAKVWGSFKGKANMTYNNLSRAIRYYYEMGIMNKVKCHQFRYKFTLDIHATIGYTFAEMRRLYERDGTNPSSPDWGRFIALRELLGSPVTAQTNVKRIRELGREMEAFHENKSEFDDDLSPEQSLYNFAEDQLASANLVQLDFNSSDDTFMPFSLEDSC